MRRTFQLFETPRTSNALLILNYLKRLEPRMPLGIFKKISRAFGAWGIYLDGLEQFKQLSLVWLEQLKQLK